MHCRWVRGASAVTRLWTVVSVPPLPLAILGACVVTNCLTGWPFKSLKRKPPEPVAPQMAVENVIIAEAGSHITIQSSSLPVLVPSPTGASVGGGLVPPSSFGGTAWIGTFTMRPKDED